MPDQTAIDLLKKDHATMKKLLSQIASAADGDTTKLEQLVTTMKAELTVHERIEEEIFYPALREHAEAKEIVLEGYAEHQAVDMLLDDLEGVPFDDESWKAKFTVIQENIEHHVFEEEGEMFEKAEEVFDEAELISLGEEMLAMKQQYQSAA